MQDSRQNPVSSTTKQFARSLREDRRILPAVVAIVALILLSVSIWTVLASGNALRKLTGDSLRSNVTANVATLEMWLAECRRDAQRIASDAETSQSARALLQSYAATKVVTADKTDREVATLSVAMQSLETTRGYIGWTILDTDGHVVLSSHDALIGQTLPIAPDSLDKIRGLSATVCRPFRCPVAFLDQGPLSHEGGGLMVAMAPIAQGGRAEGSLGLMLDPMARFSRLMSITRTGVSGETYAFDRQGTLLSQSRFDDQLRAAGLLDAAPWITSPLNISIRDPGFDINSGHRRELLEQNRPLTLMADQATRGAKGSNVSGYNNYRGVTVVGAWQWLPEYGIGVASEIDAAEAYMPLRLLWRSLYVVLGLTALSYLGFFWIAPMWRRFGPIDGAKRRLGQYELGELVGRGGMGSVYRGHHHVLRRDVAIKVLEGNEASPHSVTRFEREVRLTAGLRHPNTIAIYDYGTTDDGAFFYVMEYIDGITIQDLVDDFGRQSPQRVIYLLLQICGSLSEAHQQGLVHRDIKPANILLTARAGLYDMIKVLDFGLVKEIERETVELTQSDAITGTPMYMSPESVRDAATANEQSDLYSIGAVGYTLLTGLPTFEADATVDICLKQLNEDPIRPSERIGVPLPEDLQNVLMSCLRKDPLERPQCVQDFADALRLCDDAYGWSAADAYRWWHEVYDRGETESGPSGSGDQKRNDSEEEAAVAENDDWLDEETQDQKTAR